MLKQKQRVRDVTMSGGTLSGSKERESRKGRKGRRTGIEAKK